MPIKNVIVYSQTLPPFHVGGVETNAYHLIRYLQKNTPFRFSVVTATKKKFLLKKETPLKYGDVEFNVLLAKKKTLREFSKLQKLLVGLGYEPSETVIYHNSLDLYKSYGQLRKAGYGQVARSGGNDLSFLQKSSSNENEFCDALSKLDRLFVNSNYSFSRAVEVGVPASVLEVVKGGCEIQSNRMVDRVVLGLPDDRPIILTCGRLVDFKGIEDALDALFRVVQQGFNPLFVLVGQGVLEEKLKQQAQRLGVEQYCRFVGKVDPSRVVDYYNVSDIYLSTSKDVERVMNGFRYIHTETMGRSICEAQGRGLPVVATDAGGASEMVVDGVSGMVVPQADAEAISGALIELLQDNSKRKTMSDASWNHAKQELSWKAVLSQYCRVIADIG